MLESIIDPNPISTQNSTTRLTKPTKKLRGSKEQEQHNHQLKSLKEILWFSFKCHRAKLKQASEHIQMQQSIKRSGFCMIFRFFVLSLPVCVFYQREILVMATARHANQCLFLSELHKGGHASACDCSPVSVFSAHALGVLWWVWQWPTVKLQLLSCCTPQINDLTLLLTAKPWNDQTYS